MFWSKQRKSIWISAWNLAFSVFISPIWYQYESVNFKELHKSHTKAKDTIDRKKRKSDVVMSTTLNTRIYIRTNTVTHMFTYISNRISFSFHLKFPFFISMKVICWGRFPFINFIFRFTITIVTPKYHKLNFNRSVMLRGGHRPSDKGGGLPDPEIRGGGLKTIFFGPSGLSLVQK